MKKLMCTLAAVLLVSLFCASALAAIPVNANVAALIGEDGTIYKPITTINGEKCAQVMLVMGSDAKYTHPEWQQNLSLAVKIQKEMNTLWPTLARPIGLRENRYNQQLTTGSLLVEVGSHGNTLQEALAAARMFARAAGAVLLEQE